MKKLFSFMICAVLAMAAGCKNFNHGKSNNSKELKMEKWIFFETEAESKKTPVLTECPAVMNGKAGIEVAADALGTVDLQKYFLGKPGQEGWLYCTVDCDGEPCRELLLRGDYWWDLYLNGEKIYTTFPKGSGSPYTEHRVTARCRAGSNILAVRLRSGSNGWALWCQDITGKFSGAVTSPAAKVDFSKACGNLRKWLHNSSYNPNLSTRVFRDHRPEFRKLRFGATRTHDMALCNPGMRIIDTPFIFPLPHLDENDPANYCFEPTDDIMADMIGNGQTVLYRLGASIDHALKKNNITPPEDFAKYARILANIIRHYNYGWGKNGQHYGLKYWEIWCEPENPSCWGGTMEQFMEFFAITAKFLKKEFPDLKIGGPGFCNHVPISDFLKYCRANGVPLDFVSYHGYLQSPEEMAERIVKARKSLDENGYGDAELFLTEWHFIPGNSCYSNHENSYQNSIELLQDSYYHPDRGFCGVSSAAYNGALMTLFHDNPLDQAYYYGCGSNVFGFFDQAGKPNANYYSMLYIGELLHDYPQRMFAESRQPFYLLAGKSKAGKCALLISRFHDFEKIRKIRLDGIALPAKFKLSIVDEKGWHREEILEVTEREFVLPFPDFRAGGSMLCLMTQI